MQVELKRIDDGLHFEALGSEGVTVHIDGQKSGGGTGMGARPMELLLMGLGGCSAFDVVSILKKQKQTISDFKISVKGERREEIPTVFTKIHLQFDFKGQLDEKKVQRAIELSVKKYCSVHAMLEKTAEITWSVTCN